MMTQGNSNMNPQDQKQKIDKVDYQKAVESYIRLIDLEADRDYLHAQFTSRNKLKCKTSTFDEP